MEISRSGAYADCGTTSRDLGSMKIALYVDPDANEDLLWLVFDKAVQNFSGNAHHTYRITMSLKELGEIINFIGHNEETRHAEEIANALTPHLRALMRLTLLGTGMVGIRETPAGNGKPPGKSQD